MVTYKPSPISFEESGGPRHAWDPKVVIFLRMIMHKYAIKVVTIPRVARVVGVLKGPKGPLPRDPFWASFGTLFWAYLWGLLRVFEPILGPKMAQKWPKMAQNGPK